MWAIKRLMHRNKATYSITSSARAKSDGGTSDAEHLGDLEVDDQLDLTQQRSNDRASIR